MHEADRRRRNLCRERHPNPKQHIPQVRKRFQSLPDSHRTIRKSMSSNHTSACVIMINTHLQLRVVLKYNYFLNSMYKCLLSSQPKIEWLKNQMVIGDDPKFRQISHQGICSLEIRKPCSFDGGVYTCRAKNAQGEATVSCKLEVKRRHLLADTGKRSRVTYLGNQFSSFCFFINAHLKETYFDSYFSSIRDYSSRC